MSQVMERPVRSTGATNQPLVLGIDFGTSNCLAHVATPNDVFPVELESGSLKLCKAGKDSWEDVDLGI